MKNFKLTIRSGVILLMISVCWSGFAQAPDFDSSTADLAFLIGEWEIERIYRPASDEPRRMYGSLTCAQVMDDQFIKCTYEMERPGQIRALDEVYFNYNTIYNQYESLWLSSTWPVKVLMQGTLRNSSEGKVLSTEAQFEIQNDVTEFVRGKLTLNDVDDNVNFERQTWIRLSSDETDDWLHHMTEYARRL